MKRKTHRRMGNGKKETSNERVHWLLHANKRRFTQRRRLRRSISEKIEEYAYREAAARESSAPLSV